MDAVTTDVLVIAIPASVAIATLTALGYAVKKRSQRKPK